MPSPSRKQQLKVEKFDGKSCVETFLVKFDTCAKYNGWNSEDKAAHLKTALAGGAGALLWDLHDAAYEDIVEKLRQRYGTREQQEKFRTELKYRRRKPGESLQELAQDVERITTLAYPTAGPPMRDILGKDAFIDSLNSPGLEYKVREREPHSFSAAVTSAMKLEVLHKSLEFNKESQRTKFAKGAQVDQDRGSFKQQNKHQGPRNVQQSNHGSGQSGTPSQETQPKRAAQAMSNNRQNVMEQQTAQPTPAMDARSANILESMTAVLRDIKQEMASLRSQSSTPAASLASPTRRSTVNPWSNYPPSVQISDNGAPPQAAYQPWNMQSADVRPPRPPPRCYGCNEVGHFRRDCPNGNGSRPASRTERQQSIPANVCGATITDPSAAINYLRVMIGGKPHLCLLDTGCEVTLIPAKMVNPQDIREDSQRLLAANGTSISVMGVTMLNAHVGTLQIMIQGFVSQHVENITLGIDWFRRNNVIWNFASHEVTLAGQTFRLVSRQEAPSSPHRVYSVRRVSDREVEDVERGTSLASASGTAGGNPSQGDDDVQTAGNVVEEVEENVGNVGISVENDLDMALRQNNGGPDDQPNWTAQALAAAQK